MTVTFLLSKHPYAVSAGDTRVTQLLMDAVAENDEVRGIALSARGDDALSPYPIFRVAKPPVRRVRLGTGSRLAGRSVIHQRFVNRALIEAVAAAEGTLVAEHTYMAEAALARPQPDRRLAINTHVLESSVLAARAAGPLSPLMRREAVRAWRDELRCTDSAYAVACLGEEDRTRLQQEGVAGLTRLDLILPPGPAPSERPSPRAVFVGDRTWAPNRLGAARLAALWPRIRAGISGAELVVVGRPARRETPLEGEGIRVVGFVDSIEYLWRSSRVLLAPIPIGGGTRVKLLEAASYGLPVVSSPEAAGSIPDYLPIKAASSDAEFVARARALLRDERQWARESAELHERNRSLWLDGFVQRQVATWLKL